MKTMINSNRVILGSILCAGAMLLVPSFVRAADAEVSKAKCNAKKMECTQKSAAEMEACKVKCEAKMAECVGKSAAEQEACKAKCEAKMAECKAKKAECAVKKAECKAEAVTSVVVEQTMCPVMGGAVNKALYVDHDGKRIYVCCMGCIDAVKKDPAKYVKEIEAKGITLAATPVEGN